LIILVVFCKVIEILLGIVLGCMFLRAIFSFFPAFQERSWFVFICVITELFVAPVRQLLWRLNIGQQLPVDIAFFLTYVLLTLVRLFLPAV
jgi:uncharacterized protein YggT (Ycf19 family)